MKDFNTNFSVVDQADKKKINRNIENSNKTMNIFDSVDTQNIPHQNCRIHIFQWNICDHILMYKRSCNKFQKHGMVHIAFFDHIGIK